MIHIDLTNQDLAMDNKSLFQWDYGQVLEIAGLTVTGDIQIHFARQNTEAEIRIGTYNQGAITVAIPDAILQKSGKFNAYIYLTNETSGQTAKVIQMNVREREKPTDYTSPQYVDVVNQLNNKLNQIIETGIGTFEPDPAVIEAIVTEKVNAMIGSLGLLASKDSVAKTDLTTALVAELDGKINSSKITTTLAPTQTGFIHDAKTVGDAITAINNSLANAGATIVTGTFTPTSAFSVYTKDIKQSGKMVIGMLYGTVTIAGGSWVKIGTISGVSLPASDAYINATTYGTVGCVCRVTGGGDIFLLSNAALSGIVFTTQLTYIT